MHCRFVPDRCVTERKFLDNASLGRWSFGTLRSLDDSSFWQCTYDPLPYWWGANVTSGKRRLCYPGWTPGRVTQVFGVITHRLYATQGRDASVRVASCKTFCLGTHRSGDTLSWHKEDKRKEEECWICLILIGICLESFINITLSMLKNSCIKYMFMYRTAAITLCITQI